MEHAGITTVSLTPVWTMTAAVGAPRVAAIEHPAGRLLGSPGDGDTHRQVLRATLAVAKEATTPGHVAHLPFRWPQPVGVARREGAHPPPPIAHLLQRKPWLLPQLFTGKIPKNE